MKKWRQTIVSLKIKLSVFLVSTLMLVLILGTTKANDTLGQVVLDKVFTLNLENVKLKTLINEVQKKTQVNFSFSTNIIDANRVVSYSANKKKVNDFLRDLEKNYKIGYKIIENRVILYQMVANATSENLQVTIDSTKDKIVKGTVINEKGEPLVGVSILEKGKVNGTSTNDKGEFTLKLISEKAILIFSSTGYEVYEVKVTDDRVVKIRLTSTIKALEDVVVIGYGTVKKSDLTGSVSKVKLENAAQQTSSSYEQLLQGKTAGVNITQNSGDPGSGITFNIRGTTSLGSNQPLIVIDGIPVESDNATVFSKPGADYFTGQAQPGNVLANINPNDIESIEILKDASSTAIYGSRGANGVVMITTKRGKATRDKFSYNYRYDASQIPKEIPMLNNVQFIAYQREANNNSGKPFTLTGDTTTNINWQDVTFQKSNSQDHQVSILGGDDKTKYSLGANYTGVNGVIRNTYYNKEGISFNLDRQASQNLKVGITSKINFTDNLAGLQSTNHASQGGSNVGSALRLTPLGHPLNADGEINTSLKYNPLSIQTNSSSRSKNTSILANVFGEYSIIPRDLKLRVSGSINQNNSQSDTYWGRGTTTGDDNNGEAFLSNNQNLNYTTETTLSYNKALRANNRLNAVVGYTSQTWESSAFGQNEKGFPNDALGAYGFAYGTTIVNLPKSTKFSKYLQSYLGRVNYSINSKYLFTLTGRTDGSSLLASGNKWAFFPSAAVAWNLQNEKFLKHYSSISQAKFRASYGYSGNQNIPIGSTTGLLSSNRAGIGQDSIVSGEVLKNISNPNLKWEKTGQVDIGLDIAFFKDKYQFTIDYYKKVTNDLLIGLPIPTDNGFGNYATNLGKIQNSGLEFEASARFELAKKVQWIVAGNLSFNTNKVINLGQNGQIYGDLLIPTGLGQNGTIAKPSYALGSFYGYKIAGIYQNATDVSKGPADNLNAQPGDFKYADINNDGQITPDDRTILGNPAPKYTFGLTNTFKYKGFELGVFIMGKQGQSILNLNRYYYDGLVYSASGNLRQAAWNGRWKGEGTSNYFPRAKTTGSLFDNRVSDHLVEDGSFIRLKNVNISYNFKVARIKYISSLKIFVNATNLLTITKYTGFDPEVSGFAQNSGTGLYALMQGIDFGTIPQYKTFSFGANVIF